MGGEFQIPEEPRHANDDRDERYSVATTYHSETKNKPAPMLPRATNFIRSTRQLRCSLRSFGRKTVMSVAIIRIYTYCVLCNADTSAALTFGKEIAYCCPTKPTAPRHWLVTQMLRIRNERWRKLSSIFFRIGSFVNRTMSAIAVPRRGHTIPFKKPCERNKY